MWVLHILEKTFIQASKWREDDGMKGSAKNNSPFYVTANFNQINATYFQYMFYLTWWNENDSIKYFLKSYSDYKQKNITELEMN